MRCLLLLLYTLYLHGDITHYAYYKEITTPSYANKLIKIKLDQDIYSATQRSLYDIRLLEDSQEVGYFIQKPSVHRPHHKKLYPHHYDRQSATITFTLDQPFDMEEMVLTIADRNFEAFFDLYIDDVLVKSHIKIFDFSSETGNQNFTIKTAQKIQHKITLKYDVNQAQFFLNKYKNIQKALQYLTLKSIILRNHQKDEPDYDYTTFTPLSTLSTGQISSYIFKTNNLPIDTLEIFANTNNYQRKSYLYKSDDQQTWQKIRTFTLYESSFNDRKSIIHFHVSAKYLKLEVHNLDNQPLDITHLTFGTRPAYLLFIAHPNKKYQLYYGNPYAAKKHYDIQNIVPSTQQATLAALSKQYIHTDYQVIQPHRAFIQKYKEQLLTIFVLLSITILGFIAFLLFKNKES